MTRKNTIINAAYRDYVVPLRLRDQTGPTMTLGAIGGFLLLLTASERVQHLASLLYGVAALLFALAFGSLLRVWLLRNDRRRVRITATHYRVESVDSDAVHFEAPLREFSRALFHVMQNNWRMVAERTDGRKVNLLDGAYQLDPDVALEPDFMAVFDRRVALARAGVKTHRQLQAAEAYIDLSAIDEAPLAVAVHHERRPKGDHNPGMSWSRGLHSKAEVEEALDQGMAVFAPARVRKILPNGVKKLPVPRATT